ncbi:MAG: RadC family protein [Pseudomonadales bacterium]
MNKKLLTTELPREKMLRLGTEGLTDAELLAIFLGTGVKGVSVLELAAELLEQFGGLRGLVEADREAVESLHGVGAAKYALIASTLELARRYLRHGLERGEVISSPDVTRQFLQFQLRDYSREVFACLFLDNQHRLIAYEEMFFGTIDGASVHPREVARRALQLNAAAIVFAHNHPSGVAEPSEADRRITGRLQAALALLDIRVLDHMVVGDTDVVSFAERGLLQPQ